LQIKSSIVNKDLNLKFGSSEESVIISTLRTEKLCVCAEVFNGPNSKQTQRLMKRGVL